MDLTSSPSLIFSSPEDCSSPLEYDNYNIIAIVCCVLGLLWSVYNFLIVRRVNLQEQPQVDEDGSMQEPINNEDMPSQQKRILLQLSYKISDGSMQYLKQDFAFSFVILVVTFLLVWFLTEKGLTTAISLLTGGFINMLSLFMANLISTQSSYRIAYCSRFDTGAVFRTAYKACCAIGFGVSSLSLLAIVILINVIMAELNLSSQSLSEEHFRGLFEAVAGYALGSSIVSLFTKVTGGVFVSSAEVGVELVGSSESGMPANNIRNPATIASCVGDNIYDSLGGVVEFTSLANEGICVVLLLCCTTLKAVYTAAQDTVCPYDISNFTYPLLCLSFGLFFSVAVSSLATNFIWVQTQKQASTLMRVQLIIIAAISLGSIYLSAFLSYPPQFTISHLYERYYDILQPWMVFVCSGVGVISMLLISLNGQLFTNGSFYPVESLIEKMRSSSAAGVANGLALGYIGTILPIIMITGTVYFCHQFMGFYGVGLGAIGVLSAFPILIAQQVFSSLTSNAHQMALLANLEEQSMTRSEQMKSTGMSCSIRMQGTILQASTLVGLALFGGYIFNAKLFQQDQQQIISITEPRVFIGLLLGAMIPFLFSGLILPSVQHTAQELASYIFMQLREDEGILQGNSQPDYAGSSGAVAWNSFMQSILPLLLVLLLPLALGFGFGRRIVVGYLIGLIISGLQVSLAGWNSAEVWRSAKKSIESGQAADEEGNIIGKGSECHKSSQVGNEVGSSLGKTASGSISMIIKTTGIICVIFASEILAVRF